MPEDSPQPDDDDRKDSPQLYDLSDVEIFRVGEWNGDKYSRDDLDEMVRNFDRVGFRPPVKIGHAEKSGSPAFGWVRKIKRMGDRLVADFMDLPREVFDAVKARRFDAVSSEVFWNLKRGGETFKRALKAVALLGAETPAVSGLKPLRENFSEEDLRQVHAYSIDDYREDQTMPEKDDHAEGLEALRLELQALKEHNQKLVTQLNEDETTAIKLNALRDEVKALREAKAEIEEESRRERIEQKVSALKIPAFREHVFSLYDLATRARTHEGMKTVNFSVEDDEGHKVPTPTSPVAIVDDLVERLNGGVAHLFKEHSHQGGRPPGDAEPGEDPGVKIDALTKKHMAEHNIDDYAKAMHYVLEQPDNKALKTAYIHRSGKAN